MVKYGLLSLCCLANCKLFYNFKFNRWEQSHAQISTDLEWLNMPKYGKNGLFDLFLPSDGIHVVLVGHGKCLFAFSVTIRPQHQDSQNAHIWY